MVAHLAVCALGLQALRYTGTNLSGGDFYHPEVGKRPTYAKDFIYPNAQEFDYCVRNGMNIVRIGFLWEVVQPELMKPLDDVEWKRYVDVVRLATSKKLTVLIDPHNYARYFGKPIGAGGVPDTAFADFWGRVALTFKGDSQVWFGLVNEPYDIPAERWVDSANAAIKAIRNAGAKNLILVPGVAFTGAWTWTSNSYGEPNGRALDRIIDPGRHYAIEVHQYLDRDASGTKPQVVSPTVGSERLRSFVEWCRSRKMKAFLGEFAVGDTTDGKLALEDMLSAMERDRDVWLGFTWWSAGPWWGDYMFTIEPKNGKDRPQMDWLRPHLQKT